MIHHIEAGPIRITGSGRDWPLHSREGSRQCESNALSANPPYALMQRAGHGVARLALALAPNGRRFEVACGPGNNGGDGLVAATALRAAGREVDLLLIGGTGQAPADAAWALQGAMDAGVQIRTDIERPVRSSAPDLCIDALLGLGASRALSGVMAAWAQHVEGLPVLAVDVPSGLDGDTGLPWSDAAGSVVRARHTLSLLTLRPGCFTASGRDYCGEVWLDSLGIDTTAHPPSAFLVGSRGAILAASPTHASHKGTFGDLAVIGGAEGMAGAAVLAAEAALAAGAGRVYLSTLAQGARAHAARPEVMVRDAWWTADARTLREATVVCGCGGGDQVAEAMPSLLAHASNLVLDADALNALARDSLLSRLQAQRLARGAITILTPHPLEAARLLGVTVAKIMGDRLAAARALADRHRAIVVLKGSGTVVVGPSSIATINGSGNPSLASGGTGDVLAGWLGGLWARSGAGGSKSLEEGMDLALQTSRAAVWTHGHAADIETEQRRLANKDPLAISVRARDLIDRMRLV